MKRLKTIATIVVAAALMWVLGNALPAWAASGCTSDMLSPTTDSNSSSMPAGNPTPTNAHGYVPGYAPSGMYDYTPPENILGQFLPVNPNPFDDFNDIYNVDLSNSVDSTPTTTDYPTWEQFGSGGVSLLGPG
jgi:hypothetical protein